MILAATSTSSSTMRVVSWNVNGLRATLKSSGQGLKALLDSLQADIICFQETKATRDQLDSLSYAAEGYNGYFSFCRTRSGYSGVVTFSRNCATPFAAEEGLTGVLGEGSGDAVGYHDQWDDFSREEIIMATNYTQFLLLPHINSLYYLQLTSLDAEGRAVLTEHRCGEEEEGRSVVVVNVYCPLARLDGDNPGRLDYKLKFYAALRERCATLEAAGKLVLAVGDFNCSREAIDSAYILEDPTLLHGSPSREFFQQFVVSELPVVHGTLGCVQLVDTFRYLHPAQAKAYTCWSTIIDARKTNYGTRIDYILASVGLVGHLKTSEVWQHVEGSDHCPVFAEFSITLSPSPNLPSLCSNHFIEFAGKQQKLSVFLTRKKSEVSADTSAASTQPKPSSAKKPVKRGSNAVVPPSKAMKMSKSVSAKNSSHTLLSFFTKTEEEKESKIRASLHDDPSPKLATPGLQSSESSERPQAKGGMDTPPLKLTEEVSPQLPSQQQLSDTWRSVLTGPPKPPLCKRHSEPCVLRTVKKEGPNQRKQFWVCARPGGSKGDPKARCDFFKWVTRTGSK